MSNNSQLEIGLGHEIAPFSAAYDALIHARPGILASELGGELSWLGSARERDAIRWRKEGIPTRKNENWRYLDLSSLHGAQVRPAPVFPVSQLGEQKRFPKLSGENAVEIVFLNGHLVHEWSHLWLKQKGVTVHVLSELLAECVEDGWTDERQAKLSAFKAQVENSDADRENVFAALNTSFMNDAVLISVDPGVEVQAPVAIYFYTDVAGSANQPGNDLPICAPRVFTSLGANAKLSVLEVHAGLNGRKYLSTGTSDLRVGSGAKLCYSRVQLEGNQGIHIGTTRVHQAQDSFVETQQFSFGSAVSRQDLHVSLEGRGAECVVDGLYLASGTQKMDHHSSIDHVVAHTQSHQLYKGILNDQSRGVFNGKIKIYKDAQKSSAAQLNNNLLLSSEAEVDTKPELQIEADDVKASHGATIGQMDPEHLFYLQTRAIDRDQAVQMLARGFAKEIVFRMKEPSLKARLGELVDAQMEVQWT
jgi:Fe-S cluster assembly protein SufD